MSLTIVTRKLTAEKWHPTIGRGVLLSPEGDVLAEDPDWIENSLADEGEQAVLNVFYLEQTNLSKYLALLSAAPSDTTTMATMTESATPGSGGYARPQILAADWGAPALNGGDYQTTAAEKTFGPNSSGSAWTLAAVALVSAATGTSGKFLNYLATTIGSVPNGTSYKYTLSVKAQ
jgi:hypothetical protein